MEQILERIKKDIDELKVIEFEEKEILTDTGFIGLKKGNYKLNDGHKIEREGVFKKKGVGDAVCIFAAESPAARHGRGCGRRVGLFDRYCRAGHGLHCPQKRTDLCRMVSK